MIIQGVYTALITPFNKQNQVDIQGLRQNIHFQIDNGIDGLVILGTTGETPTLTKNEQETIIKTAVAESTIPVIVGTGSNSTKETIEKTQNAQDLGAAAALIMTPYYNMPTQQGIYLHFKTISENVDIPIIIYNIPKRCGQNISPETIEQISYCPKVIAIKEASGDIIQIMDIIKISHDNFSIISGDDSMIIPIMAVGGKGVISVASNLVPSQIKSIVSSMLESKLYQARNYLAKLYPLFRAEFVETNPHPDQNSNGNV